MSARPHGLAGLTPARLRLAMLGFLLALAVPTAVLVHHAYGQLKWEAFHQSRLLAEDMTRAIDARVARLLAEEERRGFGDYSFLVVEGDAGSTFITRSPLSVLPVRSEIPGLIGWFQVDSGGRFSTPLLPGEDLPAQRARLDEADRAARERLAARIVSILGENRLVNPRGVPAVAGREDASPPVAGAASNVGPALPEWLKADPRGRTGDRRDDGAGAAVAPAAAPAGVLADTSPSPEAVAEDAAPPSQAAFDRLNAPAASAPRQRAAQRALPGAVEQLELESPYAQARPARANEERAAARPDTASLGAGKQRSLRTEYGLASEPRVATEQARKRGQDPAAADASPALLADTFAASPAATPVRVHTFESEIDPFEFSLLDSGQFVLFRKVWRDGERYIQGALIEQSPFLSALVGSSFRGTALSHTSEVAVAWRGDRLAAWSGTSGRDLLSSTAELHGVLLHRARFSAPLSDLELVYSVTRLPAGPGARVIAWTTAVLALVLVAGVWLMYRLGARQIALARQQQDFVSAVSHELKTPLTSIRMYAEMLREGWGSEEKKRGYYAYIVQESERLSRLIANVLELARMSRNEVVVHPRDVPVARLLDGVRSGIASQVEHAGFTLDLRCDAEAAAASVRVDADAFSQCLINLVDNALKFSAACERREVHVRASRDGDGRIRFAVRDFGPGVPRDQMKKIFTLFYRSGDELTRETVGTGIGLALVDRLTRAMDGRVDVANADPGAVFTLHFAIQGSRDTGVKS